MTVPLDSPRPSPPSDSVRLQKYLASCGLGSRRSCEALIADGRVSVDGTTITEPGTTVLPFAQHVEVDGRVVVPETGRYLLLHKPRGVLCTSHDPQGRKTIQHLLSGEPERLFTIGRLDQDSEGLLLVTNDGDFAQALGHPSHEVKKTYLAWVRGALSEEARGLFLKGILDAGEELRCQSVRKRDAAHGLSCYEIVLHEGKNRHIRRMFAGVGLTVERLQRIRVGNLELGRLKPGAWRELTEDERRALLSND